MFKIIVLCSVLQLIIGAILPPFIQKCSLSDPDISTCLIKATEDFKPHIKNGVPELGFPSLNPFVIPLIELQQGSDKANFKLRLTDVEISGFEDYKFEKFNYDPKALYFVGLCHFNHLHIETNYEIIGKVLVVEIKGKGKFIGEIGPSSGGLTIQGELINKNGKKYFNPIKANAQIKVSNYTSEFNGLFSENKDFTQAANLFVKENSKEILKEILPAFEKVAADVILKALNAYAVNLPYNDLFLD